MIFPQNNTIGEVTLSPPGPFMTGERVTLTITFTSGKRLNQGTRVRFGLPNTGWERPVTPQARYWNELVSGAQQRYAPFHPVNTTAVLKTKGKAVVSLECMERMLLPDEDPAEAYWRWWVTASIQDAPLMPGDQLILTYGDQRFVGDKARIQTFPESGLTLSAYVDAGNGQWFRPRGAPLPVDVVPGPAVRANIVTPSLTQKKNTEVKIALTDECHCQPQAVRPQTLIVRDAKGRTIGEAHLSKQGPGKVTLKKSVALLSPLSVTDIAGKQIPGRSNPCARAKPGQLQLFWGDLHAQSEYHVMHSQKKDARQSEWSKGISCGRPDDVYQYARDVSLLDFVAITDQGAITGVGWDILKQKAAEYYRPGQFVSFNSYEAGSPVGHRNVFYRDGNACPRQAPDKFNYMPEFLYQYYSGRTDVLMIPHHVKTWTDWSFYNPELEPVMEIYSCWGQSESPSMALWDKGMTPGAGAWEALRRGYRLGMIASSDNHVGMPGRSYPHDRQVHTPFPGGLAAVWAPELTREAIFDAIKARRCYGTTGARIILEFTVNGEPMGGEATLKSRHAPRKIRIKAHGTDSFASVEIVRNGIVVHRETPEARNTCDSLSLEWEDKTPLDETVHYYARLKQSDGEMAWSSPVWIDTKATP